LEGIPCLIAAPFCWFFLPDGPKESTTTWLNRTEKDYAAVRLALEGKLSGEDHHISIKQFKAVSSKSNPKKKFKQYFAFFFFFRHS